MKVLSLFILAFSFSLLLPAQENWELKKDKDDIQVYYRDSPTSDIKELKITTLIECKLSAAVSVVNDIAEMPNWVFRCEEAEVLQGNTNSNFVFVNRTSMPFLFTDRELIFSCRTYQEKNSLITHSECKALPNFLPDSEDYVRIQNALSSWKFTPQKNGWIEAEYFLSLDPAGSIPAWLVNWGLDYGPLKTIAKFKALVKEEKYASRKLDFIKEIKGN
ncbi:MAG: START domain-containing protein [Bacteroidia bacterium]|nr:START domain-containing protein [Bacteroidia bacterium]